MLWNERISGTAAECLGAIGGAGAVLALSNAVATGSRVVRCNALLGLAQIGPDANPVVPLLFQLSQTNLAEAALALQVAGEVATNRPQLLAVLPNALTNMDLQISQGRSPWNRGSAIPASRRDAGDARTDLLPASLRDSMGWTERSRDFVPETGQHHQIHPRGPQRLDERQFRGLVQFGAEFPRRKEPGRNPARA